MSAVLTNRLVGSAILLIAAVVFLPDLLDGQKEVNKDDFKAIPERPEFAKVTEPVTFSKDQHLADRDAALALPTDPDPQPALDQQVDNAAVLDKTVEPAELPPPTQAASTTGTTTPANSAVTVATPLQDSKIDAAPANTTQPDGNATVAASSKAEKPLSQAAFVVKVGSFGKSQNADALVTKLKAAGYPAFTRKIVNGQGVEMVSVLVGPELKKDKLEARVAQLQALAQVQGLKVIPYQVTENN